MKAEIIISGYGGQGIMLAGNLLCQAGIEEGKNVTFFPSYGAEMRGGTANCQVIISDQPIGSPVVYNPDFLIAFNLPAYNRFSEKLRSGGLIISNSDIVNSVQSGKRKELSVAANTIAEQTGDLRAANTVLLGFFAKVSGIVSEESLKKSVPKVFGEKKMALWKINSDAIDAGSRFA